MDIFVMSESDIEQVKQIEKECRTSPWSLQDYKDEIERKDGLAFVVKKQSQVVGFIVARLIMNDIATQFPILTSTTNNNLENLENLETQIEIYNIAVKPKFQNQGVGQKLINQIIGWTENLQPRSIWLEVRESNTKAIKFYGKNSFTKIFKRRNYYSSPTEDGVIMKKSIKDF